MNIELLGKFGEGLFTADGGEGHLRFESRTVIPAGSSGHRSSPVLGKIADLQAEISLNHAVQISRAASVPQGAVERAQLGLELLKTAILELARANPGGISNSDAASLLGLRSDYRGRQKDYLSHSVLGLLLREGKVKRGDGESRRHLAEQ